MFLSYMVFFHLHENNVTGFAQVASSQVHTFKKYCHIGSCTQLRVASYQVHPFIKSTIQVSEGSQLPTTPFLHFLIKFQAHVATASYLPITVTSNKLRLNQRANFMLYDIKNFVKYVKPRVKQQKLTYLETFYNFTKLGSWRQLAT